MRIAGLVIGGVLLAPLLALAESGPARFAAAKLLALEGSLAQAITAFEEAIALGPDDPYLRLELAQTLARMGGYARGPSRTQALRRAGQEANRAREMAPENPDVLALVGQIAMTLAVEDPAAAAVARGALESLHLQRPEDDQALLALGRLQMVEGEFARAADNFRQATLLRPDQLAAFAFLVEALLRSEQLEPAIVALTDLVGRFPEELDQRLRLAKLMHDRGRAAEALAVLKASPPAQAADPELLRMQALLEYQNGEVAGALATLDRLLADLDGGDESGPPRYLRAIVLASLARNEEAEAEFLRLQAEAPENTDIAQMLARVQERQGNWRGAVAVLAAAVARLDALPDRATDAAATRLDWAATLSRAEAWEEITAVLEPVLGASDSALQSQARQAYAEARFRSQDLAGALNILASPPSLPLRAKQAELLLRAGQTVAAQPILRSLADAGPEGLRLAATACQAAEAHGEAVYWLERILAETPDAIEPSFQLGASYERLGRREKAILEFERLLQRKPDFAPALNYLGYMLAERGERLADAVQFAARALRLDPENGAYADSLGWAYFQQGDLVRALEYLERAAGLIPRDATILEHLGDLYAALGNATKASAAYERALALAEENAAAVERKLQGLRNRS
jgi:tetratricopeptide (TPR) repeat protein